MQEFQQITEPEQSIFIEYFRVIRNRKWQIMLCLVAILIPIGVWTYLATPVFEAEAKVIYEEPTENLFALDVGQPFYNRSAIINITEQIKSRTMAEEVALSLPENIANKFIFPDPLPPDFVKYKFIARNIRENLSVTTVRGSEILNLKVATNNPESAKIVTNSYVARLIEWNLKKKREEVTNVRDFVENQLKVFQDKLKTAEQALQSFKEKNSMISLSETSTEILGPMTEAEVVYNQVRAEREALEQRKSYIEKKQMEIAPSLALASSPLAKQLRSELANLEEQYSSLQLRSESGDRMQLAALKERIDNTKQRLIGELSRSAQKDNLLDPLSQIRSLLQESITLDVDLETYKARERGLQRILDDYEIQLQSLPGQELQLAHLIREREVNDKIFSMLLEKREEARITEAAKVGDIHVIDEAVQPISPIRPNKKKNLALGFILGLSFGVGLALFLNSIDTSIKSQEDIDKHINMPLLATIPKINPNGVFKISKVKHSKQYYSKKLLNQFEDIPHFYEAYRTLQLNFAFASTDHKIKSVILTSAGAGEGKTLTAINMAQIFAKSGTRTLLMDCDLRRPMIHKILDLNQEPGLTNLLINRAADLEAGIQKLKVNGLSIITSGTIPPNPSEMLTSRSMKELIEKLKTEFDLIILDAPPVIAVNDATILGKQVDGICFVVRSENAKRDAVQRAKGILQGHDIKIFGVILNDVNLKSQYGYYKDYYYYSDTKKKRRKVK